MRPYQRIAELEEELAVANRAIALLVSQLRAVDVEPTDAPAFWAVGLTTQEACLLITLAAVYPRVLSLGYINDTLPGQDRALDRDDGIVRVLVSKIRTKIGSGAIETVRGEGYRLSAELAGLINPA